MIYKETKEKPKVNFLIADDYNLTGYITSFEGYMFATTDKFISEHTSFDEELVIVDGDRNTECVSMANLADRKSSSKKFNELVKNQGLDLSGKHYSCVMIDFEIESWDEKLINKSYEEIKSHFIEWATKNNRVAVMVQHFYQGDRYPHVHMLIQRKPRKHNEFQDYLISKLNE